MTESDVRTLKRMLDEEGSSELCGTLAQCMRDFASKESDEVSGAPADWQKDAETLETLAGKFIL